MTDTHRSVVATSIGYEVVGVADKVDDCFSRVLRSGERVMVEPNPAGGHCPQCRSTALQHPRDAGLRLPERLDRPCAS